MADTQVSILITAIDEASKTFNDVMNAGDSMASKLSGTADTLQGMGESVKGFTDPLIKGLDKSKEAAISFESGLAEVRKTTGLGAAETAKLGDSLKKLSRTTPMTVDALTEIGVAAGQSGIATKDIPGYITDIAKASTALSINADEAGVAFGKMANTFGMPVKDIPKLAAAINVLGDSSIASERQIVNAMSRSAGLGVQAKMTAKEVAALSATMISLGMAPNVAATATNALLSKLTTAEIQSARFKQGLDMIGISATEMQAKVQKGGTGAILELSDALNRLDPVAKAQAIGLMFGAEYSDKISTFMSRTDMYRDLIGKVSNDTQNMTRYNQVYATQLDTTASQIQLLKNAYQELAIEVGTALLPAVRAFVKFLTPIIQGIAAFAKKHPNIVRIGAALVGVAAAAGSALIAVAALTKMWSGMSAGLPIVAGLADRFLGVGNPISKFLNKLAQANQRLLGLGDKPPIVEPVVKLPKVKGMLPVCIEPKLCPGSLKKLKELMKALDCFEICICPEICGEGKEKKTRKKRKKKGEEGDDMATGGSDPKPVMPNLPDTAASEIAQQTTEAIAPAIAVPEIAKEEVEKPKEAEVEKEKKKGLTLTQTAALIAALAATTNAIGKLTDSNAGMIGKIGSIAGAFTAISTAKDLFKAKPLDTPAVATPELPTTLPVTLPASIPTTTPVGIPASAPVAVSAAIPTSIPTPAETIANQAAEQAKKVADAQQLADVQAGLATKQLADRTAMQTAQLAAAQQLAALQVSTAEKLAAIQTTTATNVAAVQDSATNRQVAAAGAIAAMGAAGASQKAITGALGSTQAGNTQVTAANNVSAAQVATVGKVAAEEKRIADQKAAAAAQLAAQDKEAAAAKQAEEDRNFVPVEDSAPAPTQQSVGSNEQKSGGGGFETVKKMGLVGGAIAAVGGAAFLASKAIGLLPGGLGTLGKIASGIGSAVKGAGSVISGVGTAGRVSGEVTGNAIAGGIKSMQAANSVARGLGETAGSAIGSVVKGAGALSEGARSAGGAVGSALGSAIKGSASLGQAAQSAASGIGQAATTAGSKIMGGVGAIGKTAADAALTSQTAMRGASGAIGNILAPLKSGAAGLGSAAQSGTSSLLGSAQSAISGIGATAKGAISGATAKLGTMNLGALAKPIATSVATSVAAGAIANSMQSPAAEMAAASPSPANTIQSFKRKSADVPETSAAETMATDLKTTNNIVPFARGKATASEFAAGIDAGKPEAELATAGMAKSVSNYLPRSPAKVGPLSDLDKTGKGLTDEFLRGIDGSAVNSKMNAALQPESKFAGNLGLGSGDSATSSSAVYSPTYNMTGNESDQDFIAKLDQHDRKFMDWLARTQDKFSRGKY